jgi:large subunit ribosomal protein L21
MYAVIKTGGKQYSVEPGTVFSVERLGAEPGQKVEFDQVLYLNDGQSIKVGTPYLKGAKVVADVLENGKDKKVIIFKFKAKKDYRKKQGHRQPYTLVQVESFVLDGKVIAVKKVALPEISAEPDEKTAQADAAAPGEKKPARRKKAAAPETEEKAAVKPAKKPTAKPKAETGTDAEKPAPKRTAKPKAAAAEKAEAEAPEASTAETEIPETPEANVAETEAPAASAEAEAPEAASADGAEENKEPEKEA